MKDDKRRKALKALAIGAPAVWAKPIVSGVVLPAHASTSSCSPASITAFNASSLSCEQDESDIAIVFDCVSCQLIAGCFAGATAASDVPDALVIIDIDTNEGGWEWEDTGINWQVTDNDFPVGMDVDGIEDGTYSLSATRQECSATVTFTVSTENFPGQGTRITVDEVSIDLE